MDRWRDGYDDWKGRSDEDDQACVASLDPDDRPWIADREIDD